MGYIKVASTLSDLYENSVLYSFEVPFVASNFSTTATFNVEITDENEASVDTPVDINDTANQILENSLDGTFVGITAHATDLDPLDTVSYSLSDDAGGLFRIDATGGEVTVNGSLDYGPPPVMISLCSPQATMAVLHQRASISVTDDPDEHDVSAITDIISSPTKIQENSSVGTVVGITASASDADAADTVTYELSNDAGGLFKIDGDGEVTVNGSLDYEAAGGDSHDITVLATSDDGSSSSKSLRYL